MQIENINDDLASSKEEGNAESLKGALTYGSIIYLTFNEDNTLEYYAFAEGFNKNKIVLKSKQQFKKDSSYVKGLFRIYPSFYNDLYKKAKETFENFDQARKNPLYDLKIRGFFYNYKIFMNKRNKN